MIVSALPEQDMGLLLSTWRSFLCRSSLCRWPSILLLLSGVCIGQEPGYAVLGNSTSGDSTTSPARFLSASVESDAARRPFPRTHSETTSGFTSRHAGLLGKNYVDGQYLLAMPPSDIEDEMDPLQGFRTSLNVASPWASDSNSPLAQDLFASFRMFQTDASIPALPAEFDLQAHEITLGTTLFAQVFASARPFVQLGWQMTQTDVEITAPGGFRFEDRDRESGLLLVTGCEFDVAQTTALRLAAELVFDPFEDTVISAELIHWLNEHCFIRGGGMVAIDAEMPGLLVGGGFAF